MKWVVFAALGVLSMNIAAFSAYFLGSGIWSLPIAFGLGMWWSHEFDK